MNTLTTACEQFRSLLQEQLNRLEQMTSEPVDLTSKETIVIGVLDGDGIGPVIMGQALRVLKQLLAQPLADGSVRLLHIDGLTLENRLAKNCAVPGEVLEQIKTCDVLLKGPTTTPKGGTLESANVTLRRELDLFANVRPVTLEDGTQWTFFRENTEGEYVLGNRGLELPGLAVDFKVTTDAGTARIAKVAFDYAEKNGKKRVSIVTKANIMKKTDGKFSAICHEIAQQYPELTVDDWYVDIMAANLVDPSIRKQFEVFLLPNLYGDILTDEAAQLQGGVGTAGSANMGTRCAMFEAIHGSAPRLVEEGLAEYASPESIFRATVMLLRHIGQSSAAGQLEKALNACPIHANGTREGATAKAYTDQLLRLL